MNSLYIGSILVVTSILVGVTQMPTQNAYAATLWIISDQATCESPFPNGSWNDPTKTCTLPNLTLDTDDLEVASGITAFLPDSKSINIQADRSLTVNDGTFRIEGEVFVYGGTLKVQGDNGHIVLRQQNGAIEINDGGLFRIGTGSLVETDAGATYGPAIYVNDGGDISNSGTVDLRGSLSVIHVAIGGNFVVDFGGRVIVHPNARVYLNSLNNPVGPDNTLAEFHILNHGVVDVNGGDMYAFNGGVFFVEYGGVLNLNTSTESSTVGGNEVLVSGGGAVNVYDQGNLAAIADGIILVAPNGVIDVFSGGTIQAHLDGWILPDGIINIHHGGTIKLTLDGKVDFRFDGAVYIYCGGIVDDDDGVVIQGDYTYLSCDFDDDGVLNDDDNCPDDANPSQTDTDGDSIGDACDTTPNGDSDGDGVDEAVDNCPSVPNALQIDSDGDGIGDECDPDVDGDGALNDSDNCPTTANADQSDVDGDGIGDVCDPDNDNDGVDDNQDNCPRVANADQSDIDGDGLGDACDPDIDGDGLTNGNDNCPSVANTNQADLDTDGIGNACDPHNTVTVDVKPGNNPATINLKIEKVITVAILGGDKVDVTSIDTTLSTLKFGHSSTATPATAEKVSISDVNKDGIKDLVVQFKLSKTNLVSGDTMGCIVGKLKSTSGGFSIEGCDAIRVIKG